MSESDKKKEQTGAEKNVPRMDIYYSEIILADYLRTKTGDLFVVDRLGGGRRQLALNSLGQVCFIEYENGAKCLRVLSARLERFRIAEDSAIAIAAFAGAREKRGGSGSFEKNVDAGEEVGGVRDAFSRAFLRLMTGEYVAPAAPVRPVEKSKTEKIERSSRRISLTQICQEIKDADGTYLISRDQHGRLVINACFNSENRTKNTRRKLQRMWKVRCVHDPGYAKNFRIVDVFDRAEIEEARKKLNIEIK